MDRIPVTIYSDFICPYCFLAENVLSRVIDRYPVRINWVGYEIHPELPQGGASAAVLGEALRDAIWSRVAPLAEQYDVDMRAPPFLPNTHLALEAAEFAKEQGRDAEFRRLVFSSYFQNGVNIGEHAVLLRLGERAGLDGKELAKALDERRYFDRIEDNRAAALDEMVTGVPTFFFRGLRIVGAQDEEMFERALQKAAERQGQEGSVEG